ncbi:Os01g0130100, partial [Oryza sativa Japonica Group]
GELEVDVHKGALDFGELLQLLLERLPDVVRVAERHVAGEDDVHLHEVVSPEGVGPHRVDVPDLLVVVPYQVRQLRQVLRRRRPADQRPHVLHHRPSPRRDRVHRDLHIHH